MLGGRIPKHLRTNIDLNHKAPVEMTPAKRRLANEQAADVANRIWVDPASMTEADREVMRQYTGLGGIDLSKVTTHEASDLGGVRFQHYTSYQVVKAGWRILEAIGFNVNRRGLVGLEPTAGIGNFIGFAPRKMKWHANEVDKLSGRILTLLYPANTTNAIGPFETWSGPKVDLVMTNVPFLKGRGPFASMEKDPKYKGIDSLHNYIIEKSIDQLRDNGVGLFLTSTGTMDAKTATEWRRQLNQKAEVVAALRLPEGAFKKNASYEGTVDLIIFRKRTQGEMTDLSADERTQPEFVNVVEVPVETQYGGKGKAYRSAWYDANPDAVMGRFVYGHNAGFTQTGVALELAKGESFEEGLAREFKRVTDLVSGKYEARSGAAEVEESPEGASAGQASSVTPVGGLEVKGGKVYRKHKDGGLYPFRPEGDYAIPDEAYVLLTEIMVLADQLDGAIRSGGDQAFIQGEIKLRMDRWRELGYKKQPKAMIGGQSVTLLPGITKKARSNELRFHDPALATWVDQDRRFWQLSKLYNSRKDGYSPYLTEQIKMAAPPKIERVAMGTGKGVVDYVVKRFGVFRDEVAQQEFEGSKADYTREMQAHPEINWDGEKWVHDREFLMGNLWPKIERAQAAGQAKELKKLKAALPPQKTAQTVEHTPQSTWWSDEARTRFAQDMQWIGRGQRIARMPNDEGKVRFRLMNQGSEDFIETSSTMKDDVGLTGDLFIEVGLNQDQVYVRETYISASGEEASRLVVSPDATTEVRKRVRDSFKAWALSKGLAHSEAAADKFNKAYAGTPDQDYSGERMFIDGVVKNIRGREFVPYPHQLAAVRMILALNGGLLAWGVGYGKTLGAVFQFAALRAAGRTKRAVFVVPGSNMLMWRDQLYEAMPGLRVKVIRGEDAVTRIPDMNDAAVNDYDAIIVSHEAFETIPLASAEKYVNDEIALAQDSLRRVQEKAKEEKGKKRTNADEKRLQDKLDRLKNKLRSIQEGSKDPRIVTLEQWDVDHLWVDEAHAYKNYFDVLNEYADKQFIQTGKDSDLGNDFNYKAKYIHERNGRGGVTLLTATPTPNKPIEIYKMLKLIAPWELENRGLHTMDDFVRNFLEIGTGDTVGLDGVAGNAKEMVLGYRNANALRDMVQSYVDVRLEPSEEVKAARPNEKHEHVYIDMNEAQMMGMAKIVTLSAMKNDALLEMGYDKMSLTGDARRIAVDPARVDASLLKEEPDFLKRSPKIKAAMQKVGERYKEFNRLQLVFLDEYKIRDVRPVLDYNGERVPWPRGLGGLNGKKGRYPARWIKSWPNMDDRKRLDEMALAQPDPANWPLKKADGSVLVPETSADIADFRPIFDEEGNIFVGRRVSVDDLHERMAEHAEKVLGIPRERILVVNGEKNSKPGEKRMIEERVERKELSLLIGNRTAMGQGLNLQTNGDAIHQIDVPWNPMPIIQSNGRFVRARHDLSDKHPVTVFYYGLRGSLDAKMYEVIASKQKWNYELWTGKGDYVDNSLNNLEEEGFDPEAMMNDLTVDNAYVEGYTTLSQVQTMAMQARAAIRLRDQAEADLKRLMLKREDANTLIKNARDRMQERDDRFAQAMEDYRRKQAENPGRQYKAPEHGGHTHDQEIIDRNLGLLPTIEQQLQAVEDKIEPLRNAGFGADVVRKAERMLEDVRANKFASMRFTNVPSVNPTSSEDAKAEASILESKRAEEVSKWKAFLEAIFPELWAASLFHLADMVATKAMGTTKLPADLQAQAPKVREYAKKFDGQAGKVPLKVLGLASVGALTPIIGLQAAAYTGVALTSIFAFRRLSKTGLAATLAKSVEMRLSAHQGWSYLETLITQAHQKVRLAVARDMEEFRGAFKGLNKVERELAANKVEDPSLSVPENVAAAADVWRRIAARVAQVAGMDVRDLYYPRVLDWDMMQRMKKDPDLLQRNIEHLVKTRNMTQEDAMGLLLNMFDGSETMRVEEKAEARKEAAKNLREKYPHMSASQLMGAYAAMKFRFGERMTGHLRYSRTAPRLLDEMYHRDPNEVVPRYLESAWRTILYRQIFGPGMEAVNQFLDTNFPFVGLEKNQDREQAEEFLTTELYGRQFKTRTGLSQETASRVARRLNAYQTWTKLFIAPFSSAKNIAFALNAAAPLVGNRAILMGILKELGETAKGSPFKKARTAGVISERVMQDIYGAMGEKANGIIGKLASGAFTPFMVSEKIVRAFAYHAARHYGERMFAKAAEGDREAIQALWRVLGEDRFKRDLMAGKMSDASADLMALEVSDSIIGNTRSLKLPYWASTPEGSVLAQFRRVAYVQTVTLYEKVLKPATRGQVGPLLRWGAMCGVSYVALQYMMSMLMGDDEDQKRAFSIAEFIGNTNALGLYGDLAEAVERGKLLEWMAGPTAGTAKNVGQAGMHVLGGEDVGDEIKSLVRKEAPALKREELFGMVPNPMYEVLQKE